MVYVQVDHAEDIFLGKTFVLFAVEPFRSLACYLDVFVVPSFETQSFVNDFLKILFQVI